MSYLKRDWNKLNTVICHTTVFNVFMTYIKKTRLYTKPWTIDLKTTVQNYLRLLGLGRKKNQRRVDVVDCCDNNFEWPV